jgi:hypothetical protein
MLVISLALYSPPLIITPQSNNPPFSPPPPGVKPLKFGLLSTAEISVQAPILPGRNHPEVEVYSISGRSREKVEKFARKHGIEKIFSGPDGYQSNLFVTASY